MTITEPMTMATDYVLAAACIAFGIWASRRDRVHRAMALWALTFFAGAASAALGGTHHGLGLSLGTADKALWEITLLVIGGTGAFMLCAAIVSSLKDKTQPYVRWMIAGLTISVAAIVVQRIGWDLHRYFKHNDVYHVVQLAGFWCLFEGARLLEKKVLSSRPAN